MSPRPLFYAAAAHLAMPLIIFSAFMAVMVAVVVVGFIRPSSSTGLDMGKVQLLRHQIKEDSK